MPKWRWLFTLLLLVVLTGCGAQPAPPTDTPAPPTPTPVPPTPTPEPPTPTPTAIPGLVTSLDEVERAVIQIEAQGTFVDPVGQATTGAGRGSGFIIDPSGLAVTNNHVVAGAALLRVWVGGETRARNARILGVSECSDLAVIDLEGEGYPFLTWYEGRVRPGLDVYAAGFPLGEPEFTLTRGIVSKERAGGETSWASVDAVIEHDATINPGNSGGPLVTADGRVVGINYRGRPDSNQYYAIGLAIAQPIIERLRAGEDVESIGINPEAVVFESGLTGIWAASVASGSPADKAGIKAGDILVNLEGLDLATDGTMADYCDILRTHGPDATLNVRVVRFATQEVWEGQLNGRPLVQVFSFAEQGREDVQQNESGAQPGYREYMRIEDDSGALTMEVPVEWSEVDGSPWTDDAGNVIGAQLTARPPGADNGPFVYFAAAVVDPAQFDPDALLDETDFSDLCQTYEGRDDYSDPAYTGRYDQYSECGPENGVLFVVVAAPEDASFLTLTIVMALTEADLIAADRIFNTFEVVGELPGTGLSEGNTPTAGNATVNADEANVRGGPGTEFGVVAILRRGDRVQAVGRSADNRWIRIELAGLPQAWVAARLLDLDVALNSLVVAAAPAATTASARGGACPPYLHKPKPGMGILVIENHLGEPLHIDRVGTTEKWDLPPKQGDEPSRLVLDLPPGTHEFIDNTARGQGHISVTIRPGSAFVSPIWYNDRSEELVYPLEIPASCR
ncbi:MAG: trypsin-like peptidase domain-containing protein [Anaerolineae bacterium]|nr:trypsin-like peptidase domain-containing protein [Anaerolineae bacterium]